MGVDVGDFENSGRMGIAVTNFDNEMMALFKPGIDGVFTDVAVSTGIGTASRNRLGFGCGFVDFDLDGNLDLLAVNGHIDETVRQIHGNTGYAQAPLLFLNDGKGKFREVSRAAGDAFAEPKVGRGLAFGDFDRDGDVDVLVTANQGPAFLYRNDITENNRSLRVRLIGTKSNRDAVGARLRVFTPDRVQTRMVKTGSSYLSQSELALIFGLGHLDRADRIVIDWPSGKTQEFKNVVAGAYECVEGFSMTAR
jgi:hypothetical protein